MFGCDGGESREGKVRRTQQPPPNGARIDIGGSPRVKKVGTDSGKRDRTGQMTRMNDRLQHNVLPPLYMMQL